jgi:hypothetical protein
MSARTLFRSHLLQQWTQQQGRALATVIPWLRPSSSTSHPSQSTGDDNENSFSRSSPAQREVGPMESSSTRRQHQPHRHRQHTGHLLMLSSIDTATSSQTESPFHSYSSRNYHHINNLNNMFGRNDNDYSSSSDASCAKSFSLDSSSSSSSLSSWEDQSISSQESDYHDDEEDLSKSMQSLLMSRRTATKLKHATLLSSDVDSGTATMDRQMEEQKLMEALHRAVRTAQMAPNHKRTEPFSFKQIVFSSQTAKRLADICYHVVTLRKPGGSEPVARKKRKNGYKFLHFWWH